MLGQSLGNWNGDIYVTIWSSMVTQTTRKIVSTCTLKFYDNINSNFNDYPYHILASELESLFND